MEGLCTSPFLLKIFLSLRNNKTRPSDHQLINPLQIEQQDAQSDRKNSNQAGFHRFQWSEGKNEEPDQVSEAAGKNLDTTPARRLASTSRKILTPNQLASKADTAHDPKGEPVVDLKEVLNQSQDQTGLQEHVWKTFPGLRSSESKSDAKQTSSNRSSTCQPKNHVVFLKTHKTASSTILNILYRYGDAHNLTFALPVNMYSQLYYPAYFMSHFVEGVRSHRVTEFHIMCNHMRFRGPEVSKRE